MKYVYALVLLFSVAAFAEHDSAKVDSKETTRPEAPVKKDKSMTGYIGACIITHANKLMFKTSSDGWATAESFQKKDKEGTFLNADERKVEYVSGDYLLKTNDYGWFKAKDCKDLSKDTTETDPRCRYSSTLNLKDVRAVSDSNKECAIEWEALRYTVAKRLAIPYTEMWKEPFKTRVENEMNAKWNPLYSYYMRQRAKEMDWVTHPSYAHGGDYNGPTRKFNENKESKYTLNYPSENAWPNSSQGKTVDEIAFNLTETRAAAGDGNPAGLNYHPGHAENVMSSCDIIGVGVKITGPDTVSSYFQFATKGAK